MKTIDLVDWNNRKPLARLDFWGIGVGVKFARLNLGYDENSSSPYMERVKRAQLGNVRFEGVTIFRNSGRTRPELRNWFFGGTV